MGEKWILKRTIEDVCLLCGAQGNCCDGLVFRGRRLIDDYDEDEILVDEKGWIYLSGFQICPDCFEEIYNKWKFIINGRK